jgi:hypothetical protein
VGEERERKIEFLLGAISCCPLYLLWRTPPQKDAAPIRARRFGFMRRFKKIIMRQSEMTGVFLL